MDAVSLQAVEFADKPVLQALMELYLYDTSEFSDDDVDEHGRFGYRYLDYYWTEDGRYAFFIRVAGRIAGLALVRRLEAGDDPLYEMAEFFVMVRYRGRGIGRAAAAMLFDRFPGRWEVAQLGANLPAQAFWRKVIGDYTGGDYREEWSDVDYRRGPVQMFRSGIPRS